jgi:hypothetical protein
MKFSNIDFSIEPVMPERHDFRIGCIGVGFIIRDCHLMSDRDAGFNTQVIPNWQEFLKKYDPIEILNMGIIECCYQSIKEQKTIYLSDIINTIKEDIL